MERRRRRVVRKADVEYDRSADTPPSISEGPGFDDEREVLLDDDEPGLDGIAFYEAERPPHHGE